MIVVDASAAVAALLRDGEARGHLEAEGASAPHLIDAEVLHALRRLAARGIVDDLSAHRAIRRWRQAPIKRVAMVGLLERVWAMRHNVSAYDACYAALAGTLGCPLVTADRRLAGAPGLGCSVTHVPN